jgi:hypothetical protein
MEDPLASPPPPTAPRAEVRARHPQMLLRLAEERAPAATLPEATRAALAAADPMAWLPVEVDVDVVEAMDAALGPGAQAVLEARQREEMKSSIFDGFVKTALRAFAPSPANMVTRLPSGWGRIFRNAGWVAVVSTGRHVAVARVHRLPAPCIRSAPWMAALPVSLATLYELIAATGTVDCQIEDPGEGTALLTFRWK